MRVAVLGGGFQGCCIGMALAMRGVRVTILDRGRSLMSRTAVANEGKVHLGYMYAADRSMKTARMMIDGALSFSPFLSRALERPQSSFVTSQPTAYLVHRQSQCSASEAIGYISKTHELILERARGIVDPYFGQDLIRPLVPWTVDQIAAEFDPGTVLAAVSTPEIAIDPVATMAQIRSRIHADPMIEVLLEHEVEDVVSSGPALAISGSCRGERFSHGFDHAVNALWEGRLAIDAKMGLKPQRPWLHRLKYGISLKGPGVDKGPRSSTIISGPFGEVVNYPDGTLYLTWYPRCVREFSSAVTPPFWETRPARDREREIVSGTVEDMRAFILKLRDLDEGQVMAATVKGGPIFAWGRTDIHDPESELHNRYEIGVYSLDRYHTVDPGKLTMAPFFADECARRIAA